MSDVVRDERKIDIKVEHIGGVEPEVSPARAKSSDIKVSQ